MKVVIFSNGHIKDYNFVKNNILGEDIIICCDGGIRHTKILNIIPNYILGDLDSAPEELINYYKDLGVIFKTFPSAKDETDTELGISFAIELGTKYIELYGCIGTRFDHTLSNVNNLLTALKNKVRARIIDECNCIEIIDKYIVLEGDVGDIISLIPLTNEVTGVITQNLKYPLNCETLKIGTSRGISNIMEDKMATVTIKSGYLFVIKSKDF